MGRRKVMVEVGKIFGQLTVKELLPVIKGHAMAKCICSCGKEYVCRSSGLTSGHNKSCGCRHEDNLKKGLNYRHGMARTRFYKAWYGIIERCENANHERFKDYGGRGITVCPEWHDFKVFYEWAMTNGYREGLQIDRKDNDGPYTPWNCRWVTQIQNSRNKRTTKFITINGVTKTLIEWSETAGIASGTIMTRIKNGWAESRLLIPVRKGA
jgi:hypothetical protein